MARSNGRRSITPSPSINFDHLAAVPVPVLGGSMSFICVEPREEEQTVNQSRKDKGWAWVVCAGSFLMMFFTFGTHTCFGVFLSALLDHFKDSKAEAAWVGSISINLLFLFSPITSRLAERYGVRAVTIAGGIVISSGLFLTAYSPNLLLMYLTYGLLFGIGTSLCGTMALIVTMEYFDKHLSLATGIVASGGSLGTLSLAPLVQYLLETLGWQSTFIYLASVGILLAVVGFVFKPIKKQSEEHEPFRRDSQQYGSSISNCKCWKFDFFDFSVLKNKAFLLWIIATSSSGLGYFIPYFFVIKYSEDLGIPRSRGSWLISYLGIASTIGRILFGKLSDICCIQNLEIYRGCMLFIGLASALCPLAKTYEALVGYVVVLGLLDGSYIGLMSIVTLDIVSLNNIVHAWGILYFCQSFTYLLGPPAAGMICDYLSSYKPVFYMASASMIFGAIILLLVPCYIPMSTTSGQVPNLTVTSPNGTCTRGPPGFIATDEKNIVVEKLTSL